MRRARKNDQQIQLFPDEIDKLLRELKRVGTRADIQYFGIRTKNVLNGPDVTGMGFWSINPYVGCAFGCTYCYARFAHRYVVRRHADNNRLDEELVQDVSQMDPWLAFERRIFVKQNAPETLLKALRDGGDKYLPLLDDQSILIGSATDPYQPAERNFRITRSILEVLAMHPGLKITIITKSPLITRDIDILSRISKHSELSIRISLITLDRELARRIEPRAPTPESRIRAIERLSAAGIDIHVNCMPVLPGITDDPSGLEQLVKRVSEAGAHGISACALRLDRSARDRYIPFITKEFPDLINRYKNSYLRSRYVGEKYRNGLKTFFSEVTQKYHINGSMKNL